MKHRIAVVIGGTLYVGWIEVQGGEKKITITGEASRSGEYDAIQGAAWLDLNSAKLEQN